jgi:hypothetical protein
MTKQRKDKHTSGPRNCEKLREDMVTAEERRVNAEYGHYVSPNGGRSHVVESRMQQGKNRGYMQTMGVNCQ